MPKPPPRLMIPVLAVAHRPVTDSMAGFLCRLETRQRECAMGLMGLLGLIKSARVGVRRVCVTVGRRMGSGRAMDDEGRHGEAPPTSSPLPPSPCALCKVPTKINCLTKRQMRIASSPLARVRGIVDSAAHARKSSPPVTPSPYSPVCMVGRPPCRRRFDHQPHSVVAQQAEHGGPFAQPVATFQPPFFFVPVLCANRTTTRFDYQEITKNLFNIDNPTLSAPLRRRGVHHRLL